MSWSYSGDPSTSTLDNVRVVIGDTDESIALLTNEEINFALTTKQQDVTAAAILCCQYIIAKTAPEVDYKIGGHESISGSQRITNYTKLLHELRRDSELVSAVPDADVSDERLFEIGMFDNKRGW